jgi:AcrR family transcriptional regulator
VNTELVNTEPVISLLPYILQLEQEGRVTRTFRRLDPQRQQAVLFAILDEAAARGPAALSIKEVARRAGVSVGSLYQYFNDRDTMLDFAVRLTVHYVNDLFDQYRPFLVEMPLQEALSAYLAGGIAWSREQAGLLGLFARAAYHGDPQLSEKLVRPIAAVLRQTVQEILEAAQARGELRPDLDLEATARLINLLTIGLGDSQLLPYLDHYFQVGTPGISFERLLAAMLALVNHGVGSGASGSGATGPGGLTYSGGSAA